MKRVTRVSVTMMAAYMAMLLPAYADGTGIDPSYRKGRWEVLFAPQYTLVKHLAFDGGTTAKINDTWGFNFQFGYNFNEHWNLGGIFSWSRPDYQAAVQPAAGNTSPPTSQSGTLETNTFALITTYNVLAGPLTPYIDGNIGGTHINTDVAAGPPVAGCYWDPWYGYICGVAQPTKDATYLSFGVGGGVRWDVNSWLLLRAGFRQQWVDVSNTGIPGFSSFKLDVGFKF